MNHATDKLPAPSTAPPRRFRHLLIQLGILTGLALATALVAGKEITVGGLSWSDAPLHTMDGVMIHDLVRDWPEGSLREWAEQYYLRYQCLGIIVYYPPLFAAVEAVVFLLLGVSIFAARLTVLVFTIASVWLIYAIGRRLCNTQVGLAGALLALCVPAGVTWSRQVMLEWPAVCFIALAVYAYAGYLRRPGWRFGLLFAVACVLGWLTKQTAVFVLLLALTHAWWDHRLRHLHRPSFVVPVLISVVVIIAYAVATRGMNQLAPELILGSPPFRHLINATTWTWYLYHLPAILGWPVLLAAGLAILIIAIRHGINSLRPPDDYQATPPQADRPGIGLIAAWAFVWYVICAVFAAKEQRYFFYAVPALALVTAGGLTWLNGTRRWGLGTILLILLCGWQFVDALRMPANRLPTMRETVRFLADQGDADLVLVDAVRDGQFIFDVRTSPEANGKIIPMRASKFLYSRAARTRYDYEGHIKTRAELIDWLNRYGVRYIVLEDRLPETDDRSWDTPPRLMLREALVDTRLFERVHTQSLAGGDPAWDEVQLLTYRYHFAGRRESNTITVRIPALGREIQLELPEE